MKRTESIQAIPEWMQGQGAVDLTITDRNRQIKAYRHLPSESPPLRIRQLAAHPDDTALYEGLEGKFIYASDGVTRNDAELVVVTALDGRGRQYGTNTPEQVGQLRVQEDRRGGKLIGANASVNLGFESDGFLHKDEVELTETLIAMFRADPVDVYLIPHPEETTHVDHRTIARSTINALHVVTRDLDLPPPLVMHADTEDGTVVDGFEPTLYYPLQPQEYMRFVYGFLEHESQTGPHLTEPERAAVRRVLDRPSVIGDAFGIPFAGKTIQNMDFSHRNPADLMADNVVFDMTVSSR